MTNLYNLLLNEKDLKSTKFHENIKLKCSCCGKVFLKHKRDFLKSVRLKRKYITCSKECKDIMDTTSVSLRCEICCEPFVRYLSEHKKHKKSFCSSRCSCIYHNAHKTTGTTRSKLEVWIETQLNCLYPNMKIDYNKTDAIKAELDIYIPALRLAFELNGIFHYEPIFGSDRLSKTQNTDQRKFKLCIENNISLCVINTTGQRNFQPQKYLDIIINIINQKIEN